jgi:hypothetical protein
MASVIWPTAAAQRARPAARFHPTEPGQNQTLSGSRFCLTSVIYPTVRDDFGLISMIEMDFAPVRMTGRMSGKSEMPHFCNEKRPDQGKLLTLAV